MTSRIFHFVASMDGDIPVAICLEHDLVTQSLDLDGIRQACVEMLVEHVAAHREEGLDPWTIGPPPDEAVAEIRDVPGSFEFEIVFPG